MRKRISPKTARVHWGDRVTEGSAGSPSQDRVRRQREQGEGAQVSLGEFNPLRDLVSLPTARPRIPEVASCAVLPLSLIQGQGSGWSFDQPGHALLGPGCSSSLMLCDISLLTSSLPRQSLLGFWCLPSQSSRLPAHLPPILFVLGNTHLHPKPSP